MGHQDLFQTRQSLRFFHIPAEYQNVLPAKRGIEPEGAHGGKPPDVRRRDDGRPHAVGHHLLGEVVPIQLADHIGPEHQVPEELILQLADGGPLVGEDEAHLPQLLRQHRRTDLPGTGMVLAEGMIAGQHQHQLLPAKRRIALSGQVVLRRHGDHRQVDLLRLHHGFELQVPVLIELQGVGGELLLEGGQAVGHQIQPPGGASDPDAALVFQRGDAVRRRVLDPHDIRRRLQIDTPGIGGCQSVFVPDEQRRVQLRFQLQKVLAEGGLGDEQLLRRPGDGLLPGNLQNVLRVFDIHSLPPLQSIDFATVPHRF